MSTDKWTLYGQELDLDMFLKFHPGGTQALLLGKGRDCTQLFEQYHMDGNRALGVLTAFAAKQNKVLTIGGGDAFHNELLTAVRGLSGRKTSPLMAVLCILTTLGTGWAWIGWLNGSSVACLVLPFIHWLFMVNVAHDAAHFAFSSVPAVNEYAALVGSPLYFNTTYWYLQHNISHHGHTNTVDHDIDLYHGAPFVRFHSDQKWHGVHSFQLATVVLVNFLWATLAENLLFPINLLMKTSVPMNFFGHVDHIIQYNRLSLFGQIAITLFCVGYPLYMWVGFGAWFFALYPFFTSSIIFMTVTQISHIQAVAQKVVPRSHWSHQMVESSLDYSQGSVVCTFLTGGLNMQGLHHCVPGLSSSRYLEIYPTYRALCKKHGLTINETESFWTAIGLYWIHIHNLSRTNRD
jgi:fatty acid desaturase